MTRPVLLLALALLPAAAAAGDGPARLAAALVSRGLTHVEITVSPSRVWVEASGGGHAVEAEVDRATRRVLEREVGRSEDEEEPGVEVVVLDHEVRD